MNSNAMAIYEAAADGNIGWTSVAPVADPWFMRTSTYSKPNGDYEAYCWLDASWKPWTDDVGWRPNDNSCEYCFTDYLCSTNKLLGTQPPTVTPAPTTTRPPRRRQRHRYRPCRRPQRADIARADDHRAWLYWRGCTGACGSPGS